MQWELADIDFLFDIIDKHSLWEVFNAQIMRDLFQILDEAHTFEDFQNSVAELGISILNMHEMEAMPPELAQALYGFVQDLAPYIPLEYRY